MEAAKAKEFDDRSGGVVVETERLQAVSGGGKGRAPASKGQAGGVRGAQACR